MRESYIFGKVGRIASKEVILQLTSGYAMVVHGRPKTPKISLQVFWGHPAPAPRGRTAPIF